MAVKLQVLMSIPGKDPREFEYEFDETRISIGRDQDNEIQVPLSTVSRKHCVLFADGDEWYLEDLKSTHGTKHNGKPVGAGGKKLLRDGDTIDLIHFRITFQNKERVSHPPMTEPIMNNTEDDMARTLEDPEGFPPTIGRYRVLRQLSHGVASSVYAVDDPVSGRALALKLARDWSHTVADARIRNEVRALQQVQSPHLLAVHDVGEHEGQPFFTMDLVIGCTIDTHVDAEPVVEQTRPPPNELSAQQQLLLADPARVRRIVSTLTQIGLGLAALHARSIVHRDLQPAHMLVDANGFAILVDLSLVAPVAYEPSEERGLVVGTFEFLSPEQALGQRVDARADLYSLGVVLYMLLAGRHPFYSENAVGFAYHHARKQPPPLEQLSPNVPAELRTLAHALLAKDPDARPQRIEDVLSVFERVARDVARLTPLPAQRDAPARDAFLLDDMDAVPPARRS